MTPSYLSIFLVKVTTSLYKMELMHYMSRLLRWLLKLNIFKCKIIAFGRNVNKTHVYNIMDNELDNSLERVGIINDLGIFMDDVIL